MPEIAEVRVVRDTLKKKILNKKIVDVRVLYSNIVVGDVKEFVETLKGKKFLDITSSGKWLIFNLGEYSILSHLRMEGKYFYVDKEEPMRKHSHVVFEFDDGKELRYDDVRKFGRMELVKTSEVSESASIKKLGIEPDDKRLTSEYLLEKFKGKKQPIKQSLLDQSIINGLGNIYANEVLFAARINPFRETSSITKAEAKDIVKYSKDITLKAYEMGGSTIRSYTSSLGVIGHYQDNLKVHGKEGEPCSVCGNPIKRKKLEGRSAFYCDVCQK